MRVSTEPAADAKVRDEMGIGCGGRPLVAARANSSIHRREAAMSYVSGASTSFCLASTSAIIAARSGATIPWGWLTDDRSSRSAISFLETYPPAAAARLESSALQWWRVDENIHCRDGTRASDRRRAPRRRGVDGRDKPGHDEGRGPALPSRWPRVVHVLLFSFMLTGALILLSVISRR